jgi:hypothetical protein
MKPFEKAKNELAQKNGIVKRITFLRILRRIAQLSGIKLSPLVQSSETASGSSHEIKEDDRKQWGVSLIADNRAKVGYGSVMVSGSNESFLLNSESLSVGRIGYVGVSATLQYAIGAGNDAEGLEPEWMGWVNLTGEPTLTFKAEPPQSYLSIDFSTVTSTAGEVFVPLAYIENGAVVNLIRDGIVIRLAPQGYIPEPLFSFALV